MAHNPIFGSDPPKPASSAAERGQDDRAVSEAARPGNWDLGELAAKFAEHGGGKVSPELSADLALQIVLNEIVEQACLATGASGAAIVLERGGEWVCRASTGRSAPRLGARLDTASGLSGACVKTRTVQRCHDTEKDSRTDIEACRILGIRSVIILPLLQNGELVGVFEAFSTLASAFGERDEQTLVALSRRVLNNLERASGPISSAESLKSTQAVAHDNEVAAHAASAVSVKDSDGVFAKWDLRNRPLPHAAHEAASGRGVNFMTLALGAAVLGYAVLLTVLVAHRLGWRRAAARAHAAVAVSAPLTVAGSQPAGSGQTAGSPTSGNPSTLAGTSRTATVSTVPAAGASRATGMSPPLGSLMVYENGKEIFRMKPAVDQGEAADARRKDPAEVATAHETAVQRASSVEPADVLEVPADVAEGSLLHRVEPDYPEEARQQRIQGRVVLSVHIARDGSVLSAALVSGPPLLALAATDAVKQWRFKPRLANGRAAEMQTRITLDFRLPQ
jgi:TonB family protein